MINKESRSYKIYEDEKVVAFLKDRPAAVGHILIVPKEHYPIIENVPDFIVSHIFQLANRLSSAIFESLNASGTNIIVNNGVEAGQDQPHFSVNIIPRRENDNLNLQWQGKQATEEELSTIELSIKEMSESIGDFKKEKQKPIIMDKEPDKVEDDEQNYLTKSLRRIP